MNIQESFSQNYKKLNEDRIVIDESISEEHLKHIQSYLWSHKEVKTNIIPKTIINGNECF